MSAINTATTKNENNILTSAKDFTDFLTGSKTLAEVDGISKEEAYSFAEMGISYLKKGKYEKAEEIFDGLISLNPSDPYFYNMIALTYYKQEKYIESIINYTLSMNFEYETPTNLLGRGEAYFQLGLLEEAVDDLSKLVNKSSVDDLTLNRANMILDNLKKQLNQEGIYEIKK